MCGASGNAQMRQKRGMVGVKTGYASIDSGTDSIEASDDVKNDREGNNIGGGKSLRNGIHFELGYRVFT